METLVIKVPQKKSELVKALLKELGVKIEASRVREQARIPNELTRQAIKDARNRVGLSDPILDVKAFMKSL